MKRRIISMLCLLPLLFSAVACGNSEKQTVEAFKSLQPQTTANHPESRNYRTVAENDSLTLNYNPDTTDVECVVKDTGYVWGTANKDTDDQSVYAPFSISYVDSKGTAGVMNAFTDSVSSGQYKVEETQQGIKIKYTLGSVHKDYLYPLALSPERFETFYEKANDQQKEALDIAYEKKYFEDYDTDIREEMEKKYPNATDGCICTLRNENMNDNLKVELTTVFSAVGYAEADKADDILAETVATNENPIFNISMYYELDGENLLVRIPQSEIEMSAGCYISSMNVLECFKGTEANDGYFVLPDGSGSIMNYKNGKVDISDYRVSLYQKEDTMDTSSKVLDLQNAVLNIYGCREGDNAYLAVIDDSDCRAFVNACSGQQGQTARVWSSFTICVADSVKLASTVQVEDDMAMSLYQTNRYNGEIRLKLKFFSGQDANYSAMAQWYRQDLLGKKQDLKQVSMPLQLEMVCALKQKNSLLGFNYQKTELLTSLNQIEEIVQNLTDAGIGKMNLKLSGWCNGGYENGSLVNSIRTERAVGSETGFKNTISTLNDLGIGIYLDADVQYAYKDYLMFGTMSDKNTAHLLSGAKALISDFDLAVYQIDKKNGKRFVLSPSAVASSIKTLADKAEKYGSGISLRNIGSSLNADYQKKNAVDRQEEKKLIVEQLQKLKERNMSVMTSVGNYYVLPYIDQLLDTPLCSDEYDACDYSIPFLTMVISGKIEYASQPINLSNSEPKDLLRLVENGAAPYFVVTGNLCSNDLATKCARLYSSYYESQQQQIKEKYKIISEISCFYGHQLIKHERIENNVFKSTFDNGWVIVNYNNYPVEVSGSTVEAYGFIKEQGAS